MPDLYCTRADVYTHGLPRGLLTNVARRCASVDATTDTFELDGHGFELDTEIIFPRAEGGGSLPTPIVAGSTYYAIRVNDSLFKAAATTGGAAIDLTTPGANVLVATPLPFDAVIERYSRFADGCLVNHKVPLEAPIPVEIAAIVAELSATKLLRLRQQSSESMKEQELSAKAQLERWAKGVPNRNVSPTAVRTNLAISGGSAVVPPRGGTIP